MSLSSQLKAFGLAAAILAGAIAAAPAEVPTSEFETAPSINAGVKPRPVLIGHRRPHASNASRDAGLDTVRNEEEFDRKFGMCRRC